MLPFSYPKNIISMKVVVNSIDYHVGIICPLLLTVWGFLSPSPLEFWRDLRKQIVSCHLSCRQTRSRIFEGQNEKETLYILVALQPFLPSCFLS